MRPKLELNREDDFDPNVEGWLKANLLLLEKNSEKIPLDIQKNWS